VVSVFAFETANGQVVAMRSVVNPEKLGHIGTPTAYWATLDRAT
jgi:hypothetical protein